MLSVLVAHCARDPPFGPLSASRSPASPVFLIGAFCAGLSWVRESALDQLGRADGRGEGVGVAGARVRVSSGVSELDHVLVAVVDGLGERVLGRLRAGRSVRAAGVAGA